MIVEVFKALIAFALNTYTFHHQLAIGEPGLLFAVLKAIFKVHGLHELTIAIPLPIGAILLVLFIDALYLIAFWWRFANLLCAFGAVVVTSGKGNTRNGG